MNRALTRPFKRKIVLLSLIAFFSVAHVFAQAPPVISSFSPSSGPTGTIVTITGTGFNASAANNVVFFGATMAKVTVASTTSLTVVAPIGATYQLITVLNGGTALAGYSSKPFAITFTPNKGSITNADFMPRVTFNTGGGCIGIVIGDLDGDGKPDIAMANYTNNTVSIFRNTSASGSITSASFAPKIDLAADNGPANIAMSDLDGDGKLDLVTINQKANTFSLFRNVSSPGDINTHSFAARVDFAISSQPSDLAISDLDGDGKPDIILTTASSLISIFRNTSNKGSINSNSFAASVDLINNGLTGPLDLAVGDLDGDGKPDLAVTNVQSKTVSVWHNTTTVGSINNISSFSAPVKFTTGTEPTRIAISDLNGDGKPELVIVNTFDHTVSVLPNTCVAGTINSTSFAPRVDFAVGGEASGLAISDLDGDGKPDLVVTSIAENTVSVLRNISTPGLINVGSFAAKVDFVTGTYPFGLAIGDLDGDGKADIAVTNSNQDFTDRTVSVLLNSPFFSPVAQAKNLTFSNLDANAATANWSNGSGLSRAVFLTLGSTGSPSPENRVTYAANPAFGSGTQIGTGCWYCVYNDTGNSVNITGLSSGATYRVMVIEYNGTAGAENYLTTAATGNPANVTTINGGAIAINAINPATASPTGASAVQYKVTFAAAITGLSVNNFTLATAGNINGASISSLSGTGANYTVTVNTGTGDGTIGLNLVNAAGLSPGIITTLPFAGAIYTIDHTIPNGNGPPVISSFSPASGPAGTNLTITGTGFNAVPANNIVFLGATLAKVTAGTTTHLIVTVPRSATYEPISLLNSTKGLTGYSDLPFLPTFTPNKATITTAGFMPPVNFSTGNEPLGLSIGDLDGDGKPDLVLVNVSDNTVSVLRNTSTSGSVSAKSFAPRVDFATGNQPISVALGDLDGDGKPDIIVSNDKSNMISIFHNTSTVGSITASSFSRIDLIAPLMSRKIFIADIDGDGKPDIVSVSATAITIFRNISSIGVITSNSFAPGVVLIGSIAPIEIADIDGDGKPDFISVDYIGARVVISRNTSTIGQISSNSFTAPVYFTTDYFPVSVTVGDLDGDGKPDLVTTNSQSHTISILRNTSTPGIITAGSFSSHIDLPATGDPYSAAIGDLNGDGKPDLAIANDIVNGAGVSVFQNTSTVGSLTNGSFAPKVDLATGVGSSRYIAVGDLDGDGEPDIAISLNDSQFNAIAVIRNSSFFPPNSQATKIIFSNTATNSTTASWTDGNGSSRAVFIALASTGSALPVNNTTYTANPVFASGAQIGTTGWYCVYNGAGNTVNLTGLSSGATYRVMVVEYTGTKGSENYLTTTATGNPANVTTLPGGSISITSINRVTSSPTNAASVQYMVTFAASVTGLTPSNFVLATTGNVNGAGLSSLAGTGTTYTVTVNTGTGDGTIGLNLVNATGLAPGIITALPYIGPTYAIDKTAPTVTISAPSASTIASGAGSVTYTVTYADANFNTSILSPSTITLNRTGSATGTVSVSGSGTSFTVTISGITGSGALGISIAAGTATDLAGNSAAAAGPSTTFLISPVLSNLMISSGILEPVFASGITGYAAGVSNATSALTVTPVTNDPNAKVTVSGGSASTPVNLFVGLNNIIVKVTTLDGLLSTTYTIGVVRASPAATGLPPNIAYGTGNIAIGSTLPFSIAPTNTGGAVPKTNYGQVTTFAGSPSEAAGYVNGTGTAAQFNFPQQMVSDAAGNLYVADANNQSIRMISPAGVVTTFAGSLTGAPGFTDGTGTAAQFNFPDGLAIDMFGNLFVSDYNNNAIRKITPTGLVTTFYSTTNTFGPGGLCVDASGNLIVTAQDASQIIRITPSGVATIIAGITSGYVNGPVLTAQFNTPTDVKADAAGNLYVADFGNNAIRKITPLGLVTTIAGSDVSGNTPGFANGVGAAAVFNNPAGLVLGAGGLIYVADVYNNDIRRIMPDGTVSLVAGSSGQVSGDADGTGTAAGFAQPDYIYIDGSGVGYAAELAGNRIRKLVLTGYTLKGSLPAGLVFDAATGTIGGNAIIPFTSKTDTITAFNMFGYSSTIVTISYQSRSIIATLSNLMLSSGTLTPVFTSGTTDYTASVPNSIASITVTPTTTDSHAAVTVNGVAVTSGSASAAIPLAVGANTITTVVTAQDGTTTETYSIIVTRLPSADATLSNLAISKGVLTPAFAKGTFTYSAAVNNSTTTITVTPTVNNATAALTVNGSPVQSGAASAPIALNVGPNTITTVVTAQDGIAKDIYTITVNRAASSDASLVHLAVSQGTLTPAFASGTIAYADTVSNSVFSIMATPIANDSYTTITIDGNAVASGTASNGILLTDGENTITVVVTAQDGVTTDTYTISIYRGEAAANLQATNVLTPNGDGKNDYWVIRDIQLFPQNTVSVYDKAGRVVYTKRGYNNEWGGTCNGAPLAEGTYYFVVDLGPNLRKFKGFISILRN